MFAFLHAKPTITQYVLLFLAAVIIRGVTFESFILPEQRYCQADSSDYHNCTFLLAYTSSFSRPDNKEPIFWRTPGYPAYLYPFYKWLSFPFTQFEKHERAHWWAIWVQMMVNSLIPIILFWVAWQLTGSMLISWLIALLSVIHLGFVLASTYLLTDSLASVFFYLFLLLFASVWFSAGKIEHPSRWALMVVGAALNLAIYTWMRPNGEFYAFFVLFIMFLLPALSWWDRLRKPLLFGLIFFAALSPWYVRNYKLTGRLFFCPMAGVYLNSFCVPKIIRRFVNRPYMECANIAHTATAQETMKQYAAARAAGDNRVISAYLVSREIAIPVIKQYPWYFLQDWIVQVFKTVFDLFSYQLASIPLNCYRWDPPEEFLTTKWYSTLLGPIPLWMKLIGWLELFFYLFIWIGILGGLFRFFLLPIGNAILRRMSLPSATIVWLLCMMLFGVFVVQTGGFGYARLRIPVEPLLLIAALMFYVPANDKSTIQPQNAQSKTSRKTRIPS